MRSCGFEAATSINMSVVLINDIFVQNVLAIQISKKCFLVTSSSPDKEIMVSVDRNLYYQGGNMVHR